MRKQVVITDVGPRDGLQNQRVVLSVEQRVALCQSLVDAGVGSIEAGSFVSPKAVPAMAGAGDMVPLLGEGARYQFLVPNMRGYQMARDARVKSVLMVVCATETMNQKNVRASVAEGMAAAAQMITAAKIDGIKVSACVAVAWECPFEGKTDPQAVKDIVRFFFDAGADEVVLADTIGAANPESVLALMGDLVAEHGAEYLGCHFHDTRAMGLANVAAALQAGIRKFDSSVGGLGGCPFAPGATGNVATEDVVMMLHQMGYSTGIDLPALMNAGKMAGELVKVSSGGRAAKWRELQLEKGKPLS